MFVLSPMTEPTQDSERHPYRGMAGGLRERVARRGVVLHGAADGAFRHLERTGGRAAAGAVRQQLA